MVQSRRLSSWIFKAVFHPYGLKVTCTLSIFSITTISASIIILLLTEILTQRFPWALKLIPLSLLIFFKIKHLLQHFITTKNYMTFLWLKMRVSFTFWVFFWTIGISRLDEERCAIASLLQYASKIHFRSAAPEGYTKKGLLLLTSCCSRLRLWVGYFITIIYTCVLLFDVFSGCSLFQLKK